MGEGHTACPFSAIRHSESGTKGAYADGSLVWGLPGGWWPKAPGYGQLPGLWKTGPCTTGSGLRQ